MPGLKSGDLSGRTILIIDDNEEVLISLEKYLGALGVQVTTTTSGSTGLQLLETKPFDLLILDIMMPPPDGWDIFLRVRHTQKLEKLPVVFLTALVTTAQADFLNKGYSQYCRIVTKGKPLQHLITAVKSLLDD